MAALKAPRLASSALGAGVPIACSIILALVASYPLFQGSGVPALQQDWQWPADRTQCAALALAGSQPWNSTGSGSPQGYPEAWWPYFASGTLCSLVGPHLAAGTYVALLLILAGGSMLALARSLRLGPIATTTAIAVYLGNPVVLNKLQAGHLLFILSYALVPLLLTTARSKSPLKPLYCGILLGLLSAQQQFFAFGILALAVFTFSRPYGRWAFDFLLTIVVALVFIAPMWTVALFPGSLHGLNVLHPTLHWEYAQSASLADSIRLIGYTGHYDEHLLAAGLHTALWIVPAVALLAVFAREHRRIAAGAFLLVASGVLGTSGLYGPLSAPLTYAFAHVPAMAFFREFYNFAALTALGYAILIGLGVSHIERRVSSVPALVILMVCCLGGAFISSRDTLGIPKYQLDGRGKQILRAIASTTGDARFLALPATYPYATDGTQGAGRLPFAIAIGEHAPASSELAEYPTYYVGREIEQRPDLAAVLAIGTWVNVPGVHSGFREVLEPVLRPAAPNESPERTFTTWSIAATRIDSRVAVQPLRAGPASLAIPYAGARLLDAVQGGQDVDLTAGLDGLDPRTQWARTSLWPTLPSWAYALPPGLFTLSKRLVLSAPSSYVVAGDTRGRLRSAQCARVENIDAHFALYRCANRPVFEGTAPLVISSANVGGIVAPRLGSSGTFGSVRILRSLPYAVDAIIDARRGSVLALRESYATQWTLSLPDARHVEVDGYSNGWILRRNYDGPVHMEYTPARTFYAAECVSVAELLGILALWVIMTLRSHRLRT